MEPGNLKLQREGNGKEREKSQLKWEALSVKEKSKKENEENKQNKQNKGLIFAIDFDGTCVTHEYPELGVDIGAVHVLKKLTDLGHKIILYTMRSGEPLKQAVEWFEDRNIPLWSINHNPTQAFWTVSPKIYADYYIDDAAIGTPLVRGQHHREFVDWNQMAYELYRITGDESFIYIYKDGY